MRTLDVPAPGGKEILIGEPSYKIYQVSGGNAEPLARLLSESYQHSKTVRINAVNNSSILVRGYPEDHFEIARDMAGKRDQLVSELIPLDILESARAVECLQAMFGSEKDVKAGPYISSDLTFIDARPASPLPLR